MNTLSPDFLEGFVKTCFEHGLNEEQTTALYLQAHQRELLENADCRAGFEAEVVKAASFLPPGPQDAMSPWQKGFSGGGLLGTAAGLGYGLYNAAHGRPGQLLKSMGWGAATGAAAGGIGNPLMTSLHRAAVDPSARGPFVPSDVSSWLHNNSSGGFLGGPNMTGNPNLAFGLDGNFAMPGPMAGALPSGMMMGGPALATMTGGYGVPGFGFGRAPMVSHQILANNQAQVSMLDQAIAQARAQQAGMTTGAGGDLRSALSFSRTGGYIRDLERQKNRILHDSRGLIATLRRDQGESLRSNARYALQAQNGLSARRGEASSLANWLTASESAPGWKGSLMRGWNRLTGARERGERLQSEIGNLQDGYDYATQRVMPAVSRMLP